MEEMSAMEPILITPQPDTDPDNDIPEDLAEIFGDENDPSFRKRVVLGEFAAGLANIYKGVHMPNIDSIIKEEIDFRNSLLAATRGHVSGRDMNRLNEVMAAYSRGLDPEEHVYSLLDRYDPDVSPEIVLDIKDTSELTEHLQSNDDATLDWHQRLDFEPYENGLVRAIAASIDAEPATGRINATGHIVFREEGIGFVDSIDEFLKLHDLKEALQYYPFFDDSNSSPSTGSIYRPKYPGKGRYYKFAQDGLEVLMELSQDGISVTCRPTREWGESLEDTEDYEIFRDKVNGMISKHVRFTTEKLPEILGMFMQVIDKDDSTGDQQVSQTYKLRSVPGYIQEEMWLLTRINDRAYNASDEEGGNENIWHNSSAEGMPVFNDPRQAELFSRMNQPLPETTFDMIGGMDEEVEAVKKAVRYATHPEIYEQLGIKTKSTVLLLGAPGVGKTMLAEAAAQAVGDIYLRIKATELQHFYAGETEKNIAAMFEMARSLGKNGRRVVMQIDEFEALAPHRGNNLMMEHERKQTGEWLTALQEELPGIVIIASSNIPKAVDPAVKRPGRFNIVVEMSNPTVEGRSQILNNWIKLMSERAKVQIFDQIDTLKIAQITEDWSGAALKELLENAVLDSGDTAAMTESATTPVTTEKLLSYVRQKQKIEDSRPGNYL